MLTILKLNKVDGPVRYRDGDDEGDRGAERSRATYVNAATIRNFMPRRDNRPGSRITFTDGGGYAVTETPAEIIDMLQERNAATLIARSADVIQMPETQTAN